MPGGAGESGRTFIPPVGGLYGESRVTLEAALLEGVL